MSGPVRRPAAAMSAASLFWSPPAVAAELASHAQAPELSRGAFAGARLRLTLGGSRGGEMRAGVALAPTSLGRTHDGTLVRRFGDGFELGTARGEPMALRLAGRRVGTGPERSRLGVSTLGAAGIAAGVILAGAVVLALAVRSDE